MSCVAERPEDRHRAGTDEDRLADLGRRRLHEVGGVAPAADRSPGAGRDVARGAVQLVQAGRRWRGRRGPGRRRGCPGRRRTPRVVDEGDDLLLGVAGRPRSASMRGCGQRHAAGAQHEVDRRPPLVRQRRAAVLDPGAVGGVARRALRRRRARARGRRSGSGAGRRRSAPPSDANADDAAAATGRDRRAAASLEQPDRREHEQPDDVDEVPEQRHATGPRRDVVPVARHAPPARTAGPSRRCRP